MENRSMDEETVKDLEHAEKVERRVVPIVILAIVAVLIIIFLVVVGILISNWRGGPQTPPVETVVTLDPGL